MGWLQMGIILLILFLDLIVRRFLPSYFGEKGKNLATKQDIDEIVRKTEEVQNEFREAFAKFESDVRFKYDFYFKQYTDLYARAYAIIIQSEYTRYFLHLLGRDEISFEAVPFLETGPTKRKTRTFNASEGMSGQTDEQTEIIETPVSQFSKEKLIECIIDHGAFASQKLLKLAVSYRYAYEHYSGNPNVRSSSAQEIADEEEIRLIREIVQCVVYEYNFLRSQLKIQFNQNEYDSRIPQLDEADMTE